MAAFLALLRGINVGGQKKVPMADLKAEFTAQGFAGVVTYIQTGNIWFRAPGANAAAIASALERSFGFPIPVFLLTRDEFKTIAAANPFIGQPGVDLAHLHLTLLAAPPEPAAIEQLAKVDANRERVAVSGRAVYLHCPDGYGRAKLNNNFLEARLGVPATTRN
ncbi:MAG: DUF1697 domain-containing protein [Chloroflexi bacterium]|nr:DUF1697 domain-containing protein [Chloroflexota bacterium]